MALLQLTRPAANDNEFLGFNYCIYTEDLRYFKFGVSRDPGDRLRTLQVGCPLILKLGGYSNPAAWGMHPFEFESIEHAHFAPYCVQGEWFSFPNVATLHTLAKRSWCEARYPYLYDVYCRRWQRYHKAQTRPSRYRKGADPSPETSQLPPPPCPEGGYREERLGLSIG